MSLLPVDEEEIKQKISESLNQFDILIISDYGKGLISDSLCQFLISEAHANHRPVIIDPKGKNWNKYTGADLITPMSKN